MVIGSAAVVTALVAGSLALIGFGVNAVVDSSVSVLLIWRFRAEAAGRAERAQHAEGLALRLAAGAFLAIGAYVLVRGVIALAGHHRPGSSLFGVAEAAASLLVLPYLAVAKYRLAAVLGSRALRADSFLTVSGVALATLALAGLLAERALGWWWADPAAALAIALFLGWQGVQALRDARRPY